MALSWREVLLQGVGAHVQVIPTALRPLSSRLFQVRDLYYRLPESGGLCRSRQLEENKIFPFAGWWYVD